MTTPNHKPYKLDTYGMAITIGTDDTLKTKPKRVRLHVYQLGGGGISAWLTFTQARRVAKKLNEFADFMESESEWWRKP